MKNSLRFVHSGATGAIFALLLGAAICASATQPPKSTPKPPPPPKAASSGGGSHGPTGGGGGGSHGPTGGSHSMTTGGSHGPTTGGSGGSHGPTTGGTGGSHSMTTGGSHGPTTGGTGGSHSMTTGGSHGPTTGGTGGSHTLSTGGSHSLSTGGKTIGSGAGGGKTGGTTGGTHLTSGIGGKGGRSIDPGYGRTPKGITSTPGKGGTSFTRRPGGKPAGFHDPGRGIDTHHGLNGGYHGSVWGHDHHGVYFAHGRPGFVQHPYHWHGHDFGRRAYFWHGHPYYGFYHGWGWRGGYYNVYAPGFFFRPAFYGWAYNPWARPIGWGWGWGGAPWFGFYGGWFTPYPTYASPALWLTDYLISQNLEAAYAAHQEGGEEAVAGGGDAVLTPDVKEQIAEEVRAQIALENQEAQASAQGQDTDPGSSGIGRMMTDGKHHIFVANSALDVVDAGSGAECAISDGDVLQLTAPPAADATSADLVVLASKGGNECQKSATVTVNFSDLQEMQNSMRQNLDNGLKELQSKQGQGGIPQAPPSAQGDTTQAPYAAVAPPPDPADAQTIQSQEQSSQQAEQQAQQ